MKRGLVVTPTKSVGISILLTFFLGPLGMLYSTVWGAILMTIASLIIAVPTAGLGLLLTWPLCILWGAAATSTYNRRLLRGRRD